MDLRLLQRAAVRQAPKVLLNRGVTLPGLSEGEAP